MKLIDIKLTNFKKLSNLPQPTITFRDDITVLVGSNNAGKTSILQAIQKLLRAGGIAPKDLNYLVEDGSINIEGNFVIAKDEWKSFLRLSLGNLQNIPLNSIDIDGLTEKLFAVPVTMKHNVNYINRKQLDTKRSAEIDIAIFNLLALSPNEEKVVQAALNQFANSNFLNVYHTPLYLDSKGETQEREKFVPLSEIKNPRGNKSNIRGLLYALKKESPEQFTDFKNRLLQIFTELNDIDVLINEELGEFEMVLSEKLKRNGDSKQVDYDIKNVGQGMQTLVSMLSNILLLKPSIVLMDEPEVHMHPSLIKEFVKYIKQLSIDTQFIITTHSVVLMNEMGLDKLFSLKYETEQRGVVATTVDDRNKLLDTVTALGYNVDALTYTIKPKVFVFTEGISDKDLILAFASKKGLSQDLNGFTISFISMGGKGNRYHLAKLIDKMNKEFIDSPLIMILDRDETPPEQVEDIRKEFFSKNPKRLHYLSKRQIENYLLNEKAISKYVSKKILKVELKQKWEKVNVHDKLLELAELQKDSILDNYIMEIFINDSLINTKTIRVITKSLSGKPLNEFVPEFTGEIFKIIGTRTSNLSNKTSSLINEFEDRWKANEKKLEMIDGRELLTELRRWIQTDFNVSFSNVDIINEMDNIPDEINSLIEQLKKPEELKIISVV